MTGQVIGYRRVSSTDQNLDRQLDGVTVDRVFEDKCSGGTVKRPGLEECLAYLRAGDRLVCHSIDRLARNLADLERIVDGLNGKGVSVQFVKENLVFQADSSNPMNKLMFQMLGAFSQFERALIRERQAEGIAAAKARGKHLGRKATLSAAQVREIRDRLSAGATKAALAREYGVSLPTLYSALKRHPAE